MRRTRRLLLITALIVVVGVFASYAWRLRPLHVTESDIVGTWTGPDAATVVIKPDHTVSGTKAPFGLDDIGISDPWTGTATWLPSDQDGTPAVQINFTPENAVTYLYVGRHNGGIAMFLWQGDPDEGNRTWFTRIE